VVKILHVAKDLALECWRAVIAPSGGSMALLRGDSNIEVQGGCQSRGQEGREGVVGCSCCGWLQASLWYAPVLLGELQRWHGIVSVFFVSVICTMVIWIICACFEAVGGVV